MNFAGEEAGLTAADAVAAVGAFAQVGFAQRLTPLVISTPTPEPYLSVVTPILAAGSYLIHITALIAASSANSEIRVFGDVDGGALIADAKAGVAGGQYDFAGAQSLVFETDATHLLTFLVSQPAGPGQLTAVFAQWHWVRFL